MKKEDLKNLVQRYLEKLSEGSSQGRFKSLEEMRVFHKMTDAERTYYLQQMLSGLVDKDEKGPEQVAEKEVRLLSFIQGALWSLGVYSGNEIEEQEGFSTPMKVGQARQTLAAYEKLAEWLPRENWEITLHVGDWPRWTARCKVGETYIEVHSPHSVWVVKTENPDHYFQSHEWSDLLAQVKKEISLPHKGQGSYHRIQARG